MSVQDQEMMGRNAMAVVPSPSVHSGLIKCRYDLERPPGSASPYKRLGIPSPLHYRCPSPPHTVHTAAAVAAQTMSHTEPPTPMSPSVGARRKGAKVLPKLPLSAFTPPNTGTSDSFPGPPSPSTLQPEEIVDVYAAGDLGKWKAEAARGIGEKGKGVVLSLSGKEFAEAEKELERCVRNVPVPGCEAVS